MVSAVCFQESKRGRETRERVHIGILNEHERIVSIRLVQGSNPNGVSLRDRYGDGINRVWRDFDTVHFNNVHFMTFQSRPEHCTT